MSLLDHPKYDRFIEVVTTVLLAAATLLAAWSGFEAARWTLKQSTALRSMVATRIEGTQAATQAGQLQAIDVMLFSDWLQATADQQPQLADFYRARFRPEFKPAFEEWLNSGPLTNTNAAPSPFALPSYAPASAQRAAELEAESDAQINIMQNASAQVANYVTTTLMMATALFFFGISRTFTFKRVRLFLVITGALISLFGVYNIATTQITL